MSKESKRKEKEKKRIAERKIDYDKLILPTLEEINNPNVPSERISRRVQTQLEGSLKSANNIMVEIFEEIAPEMKPEIYLLRYLGMSRNQAVAAFGENWKNCQHVKDIMEEEMAQVITKDGKTRHIPFEYMIPALNAVLDGVKKAKITRKNMVRARKLKLAAYHFLAEIVAKRNNIQ